MPIGPRCGNNVFWLAILIARSIDAWVRDLLTACSATTVRIRHGWCNAATSVYDTLAGAAGCALSSRGAPVVRWTKCGWGIVFIVASSVRAIRPVKVWDAGVWRVNDIAWMLFRCGSIDGRHIMGPVSVRVDIVGGLGEMRSDVVLHITGFAQRGYAFTIAFARGRVAFV